MSYECLKDNKNCFCDLNNSKTSIALLEFVTQLMRFSFMIIDRNFL